MSTKPTPSKSPYSTPAIYAAWTIRVVLLVLYVPVQVALLFVRSMLGLDAWASAIVMGEPEKVLAAPPLRPVATPADAFEHDGLVIPPLHEIPAAEIRYHV